MYVVPDEVILVEDHEDEVGTSHSCELTNSTVTRSWYMRPLVLDYCTPGTWT